MLNKRPMQGVIVSKTKKPEFKCSDILCIKDEFFDEKTMGIAKFISEYYVCSSGDALKLFIPMKKNSSIRDKITICTGITLSKEQKKAYDFIQKHERVLLFGDTGSGKTEIYIKVVEDVINQGNKVIFLMPEIGLTPQMKKRLKSAFGEKVAIWHSKITKKKRIEILDGLHKGEILLIAGTRSALFLPVTNLGLIVVDEEHDDSYKSNQRPRYNARDLAILFGKRKGSKVLLGSATPSLGSYKNLPKFRLRGTYFSSTKSILFEHANNELSPALLQVLSQHLDKNSQIIIFLPTRANFKYVICQTCNQSIVCPFCSVGMSLHLNKNALKCHYCNFAQTIPKECPSCHSTNMHSNRIGTQEVVQRLRELYPQKTIEKFDRDEIKTQKILTNRLKLFNEKNIDILVGTQMLAKGHDYHGVGLSVVMGIDSILNMPDFRARERAMSLLLQVSGRSGRSGLGEVYIQTQNREFFEEFFGDYELFLHDELYSRGDNYPPNKKLLKILVSHMKDEKANSIMNSALEIANNFKEVEVVGSGRANIEKIANKYRYNILLRSSNIKELLRFGHSCRHLHVEIDIDPLSFS